MREKRNSGVDKSATEAEHSHAPEKIAERLQSARTHNYLRDFVYGAIDGTVTTFAVVSGVAGAGLTSGIVVVLGMANLVADGFSMAASNYLGTKADEQLREKARRMEKRHIKRYPEGEREEIRQIFAQKGFEGDDLDRAVEIITSDVERWVDTMITDELGMTLDGPSPTRAAMATFAAFVLVGLIPLLAFIYQLIVPGGVGNAYVYSALMTGGAFFGVGAVKSRFVEMPWYSSGLETLGIGGCAAVLAYLVGAFLGGLA